jgi:hypothetical protein
MILDLTIRGLLDTLLTTAAIVIVGSVAIYAWTRAYVQARKDSVGRMVRDYLSRSTRNGKTP